MSKAKNSLLAAIFIATGVGAEFVKVGEMTDIPGMMGDKVGRIDVSSFDSAGYKDYISDGLKDAPEFSLKCNYIADDLGQLRVSALGTTNENTQIKLVLNDKLTALGTGTTIIRDGYVSANPNIVPGKGAALSFEFSFQSSGAPDFTAAT
ncbi:MAG: hypothetical protein PHI47_06520 [Sulfuricurvum sp.]|uniref:hypothetical protein n=1 Tax=Sulfuricurvum sp. TaxID=2025608 RepID=UPI00262D884E|nr:hypothetical protein [Sulfuricurvum sp.]MDD5159688.1 hypothetical protein [Sulfuricurvum sp.]